MPDDKQKEVFARNLNKYLERSGKTQKEVAQAIGVIPTTFNTWCLAQALPRMGKVQLLADYFGINKESTRDIREQAALSSLRCCQRCRSTGFRDCPYYVNGSQE